MGILKIKVANTGEAMVIALLARITFSETFGHFFRDKQILSDYLDRTFSVRKIESSLAKPNNVYWTAYIDRLPVGYAKLKISSDSEFLEPGNACQLQKIYFSRTSCE